MLKKDSTLYSKLRISIGKEYSAFNVIFKEFNILYKLWQIQLYPMKFYL